MKESTDEDAGSSVRERLLLHWINSLPLTKCLLVEELRDLRFGDILHEIVRWLQIIDAQCSFLSVLKHNLDDAGTATGDRVSEDNAFESVEIMERLRRVVQFAASECRSQDEDAMYVVNNAECLIRVMSGESDAICAVLTVLKRLSVERLLEHQSFESEKDALRRRREQEKIIESSLEEKKSSHGEPREDMQLKQKPKRVQTSSSRSRTRVGVTKSSENVKRANITTCTQQESKPTKQNKKKTTKRRLSGGPTSNAVASLPSAVNREALHQTSIVHNVSGLRVFGMIDPTVKWHPPSEPSKGKCGDDDDHIGDDARAIRFCNWARLVLRVEMPLVQIFAKQSEDWKLHSPRKVQLLFVSGVLLCRIAATIVQRFGGQLGNNTLETKCLDFSASDLNTPAGKRRNFAIALTTFKALGISPEALNLFECLQRPGKQTLQKTIWCALEEVVNGVERLSCAAASLNTLNPVHTSPKTFQTSGDADKTSSKLVERQVTIHPKQVQSPQARRKKIIEMETGPNGCAPLKRNLPYITSEQMHVVNEWLLSAGFDIKKVPGRGVLQDPMRNGVLLCALLTQELKRTSFSYFKAPRTLTEMRENISQAFGGLGDLPHGQIPSCYLTSSAEQAVLIGDRQISYGILWHLWQARHSTIGLQTARERGKRSPTGSRNPENKIRRQKPSPLLLDIPAVALADQGKLASKDDQVTSYQVKLYDTFARRIAWNEDGSNEDNDNDDVFPVVKAPFPSPIYRDDIDLLPMVFHKDAMKHQSVDGIVPTRPSRSDSVEISRLDQNSDEIPPKVAIGELSVVTPIASVKMTEQGSDGDIRVPTPVAAQTQANAMLSQEPVEEILEWLKRLGIRLTNVTTFHDPNAKLTEFQSGVLLCCIVEKVEFMRNIPGITRPSNKQQRSKASALHNITKALNILQKKKTMPLHLLRRANAIYAGNRDVILQLLLQIRKAYGHHHAPHRRPKQISSSAA